MIYVSALGMPRWSGRRGDTEFEKNPNWHLYLRRNFSKQSWTEWYNIEVTYNYKNYTTDYI